MCCRGDTVDTVILENVLCSKIFIMKILVASGFTRTHKKWPASRIAQTVCNCKARHMLDLLLLIVKCPFNKIKIL